MGKGVKESISTLCEETGQKPIYACYEKKSKIAAISRDIDRFNELGLIRSERETRIRRIDSMVNILDIIIRKKPRHIIIDIDSVPGGECLPHMVEVVYGRANFLACTSNDVSAEYFTINFGFGGTVKMQGIAS